MLTLQENHYYDQQNKLIIGNLMIAMKSILLVSHWKNQSVTVRAMITSWVSRPEFSASVLGNTRRALAKASTPSCARCSKFGHRDKRRQIRQLIGIWQLQMFQLKLITDTINTHIPLEQFSSLRWSSTVWQPLQMHQHPEQGNTKKSQSEAQL